MSDRSHVLLVVVDVQERMMPAIADHETVLSNILKLIEGCHVLGIPMLVTEQYPKGLGQTVLQAREAMGEWYTPIEKMSFSACGEFEFMNRVETSGRGTIILCGVEAHICVSQTAHDLRNLGYTVEVTADAVGSRTEVNYRIAIDRMARHGIGITSVETVLFELMDSADIPEFKAVQAIVK
ncbi:MAG: hydrolase [Bacteroidetes bacterium]|nr:hydrolase [Bacteroidota bacterium]